VTDQQVVQRLREIVRLAGELAADAEHLALRNRAIEIASCAEIMVWSVAPDESDWLDAVYGSGVVGDPGR
jgi:hypothetical protein